MVSSCIATCCYLTVLVSGIVARGPLSRRMTVCSGVTTTSCHHQTNRDDETVTAGGLWGPEVNSTSNIACIRVCLIYPNCNGVMYNFRSRQCQGFSEDVTSNNVSRMSGRKYYTCSEHQKPRSYLFNTTASLTAKTHLMKTEANRLLAHSIRLSWSQSILDLETSANSLTERVRNLTCHSKGKLREKMSKLSHKLRTIITNLNHMKRKINSHQRQSRSLFEDVKGAEEEARALEKKLKLLCVQHSDKTHNTKTATKTQNTEKRDLHEDRSLTGSDVITQKLFEIDIRSLRKKSLMLSARLSNMNNTYVNVKRKVSVLKRQIGDFEQKMDILEHSAE